MIWHVINSLTAYYCDCRIPGPLNKCLTWKTAPEVPQSSFIMLNTWIFVIIVILLRAPAVPQVIKNIITIIIIIIFIIIILLSATAVPHPRSPWKVNIKLVYKLLVLPQSHTPTVDVKYITSVLIEGGILVLPQSRSPANNVRSYYANRTPVGLLEQFFKLGI